MAYASWSVVFGEQPSASKWNILGTNDASFNDGTGIGTNAIAAASLAASAITLGYTQITADITTASTSATQATGLSAAVTIPAGGRRIFVVAFSTSIGNSTSANGSVLTLWDGTVGSGTQISQSNKVPATNEFVICMASVTPSAGSKTYNVGFQSVTSGTTTLKASSTGPAFIWVGAL